MAQAPERPLVLLTIGTDHHKFDRIIGWIEDWHRDHPDTADVIVQYGSSRAPVDLESYERVPREELGALMQRAAVIVTHGGGGSITQCWRAGKLPIVVPRLSKLNEHVDEHQEAFGARLAEMGYATMARTYAEMDEQILRKLAEPAAAAPVIDATRPTRTTETIGALIDDLVARKGPRRRQR